MDTVLICVAPNDHPSVYDFFINSLQDQGWDLLIIPVTEISTENIEGVAAVLAYAVNWPKESLHGWLSDTHQAIGPRRRMLAVLPRPPHSYPDETQILWNESLGYGAKIISIVSIVRNFISGRI